MINIKPTLVLFFTFLFSTVFSQKKACESPKDNVFEDLSSIVNTKCSINSSKTKKNKKARQISVRISTSRKRYLKARTSRPRSSKRNSANVLNNLASSGISSNEKSLQVKNTMISLTNTLSSEEVRKAHKFYHVDKTPTFNKCKNYEGDKRLDCFNNEMIRHINHNFRYPSDAVRDQIEGEVWVRFIIDSDGRVTNIKTVGPDGAEILDNEAKRVVSMLPFFEPGEVNGKKVSVKYGFPINFSLDQ